MDDQKRALKQPLGGNRMLLAEGSLAPAAFDADIIRIPADETYAANAVAVGSHCPWRSRSSTPRTPRSRGAIASPTTSWSLAPAFPDWSSWPECCHSPART